METISHFISVSQIVRLEKKAKALGKTVPEYLSFFISERVGTTCREENLATVERTISCVA